MTGGLGGTPACVKQEAGTESQSLNRSGPQLSGLAGAPPDKTFRRPAASSLSDSVVMTLSRSLHQDTRSVSVQPNVSITPIQLSSSQFEDSVSRMPATTGIEIIPLGGKTVSSPGQGASGILKAKSRDLKRSLSEDDKRRLQKKEKKRRDEKIRQSLNHESGKPPKSDKYDGGLGHPSWASDSDSKSGLAGVIEWLSQKNKDNLSIEIKPASSVPEKYSPAPNMEITLNQVKKEDFSPKPKLKLTIKTPGKHYEKTEADGGYSKTTSASPKLESSTFQIPKLNKSDSPSLKKERPSYPSKSPSTSPKHSVTKPGHAKERFITDPGSSGGRARPEVRISVRPGLVLIIECFPSGAEEILRQRGGRARLTAEHQDKKVSGAFIQSNCATLQSAECTVGDPLITL